jgi:site-specific DNA-cytosine methylase
MSAKTPRALIACEESQAVTIEFRAMGVEAFSCDIQESSGGHPEWHILWDAKDVLLSEWDIVVAFPPCTDLAVSGSRHFARKQADGTQQKSIEFFMLFANCNAPRVAIENPVGIMSSLWRKPDQIINPWQFGQGVNKKTCLWLRNLPLLVPTQIVDPEKNADLRPGYGYSQWLYETSCLPHKDRAKARSKTFSGIAKAMANQWAPLLFETQTTTLAPGK